MTSAKNSGGPAQVLWGNPANRELFQGKVVFWSNWNTREVFPFALTPLTWSHFIQLVGPGFLESLWGITQRSSLYPYSAIVDLIYGRLYWNMNLTYGHPLWSPLFRRLVSQLDAEAGRVFTQLCESGELKPVRIPLGPLGRYLAVLKGANMLLRSPWFLTSRRLRDRCDKYWREACKFENTDLDRASSLELLNQLKHFNAYTIKFWAPLLLASFTAFPAFAVVRHLTKNWPDIPPNRLLAGIPGNKTTEGALELYRLSQVPESLKQVFLNHEVGEIPSRLEKTEEGRALLERLKQFLLLYGHRGPTEFDMGQPRWRDDPSFVFQMVKNYLQLGESDETPLEHFRRMAEERERLTALAHRRLSQSRASRIFPFRRWLFQAMLRRAHTYLPFRENPKYYALKCYFGSRRILLEIGHRLTQSGHLEKPNEIWFLTLSELEALAWDKTTGLNKVKALVRKRKEEWERYHSFDPPFIVRSDGKTFSHPEHRPQEAGVLRGTAACSGKATGKARVILDPKEGCTFNKGEILVALHTDPGWTPLFLTAQALVMEVGGVLSHAAIVAREYGIPAVVGVRDATKFISSGDEITVDGDRGAVLLRARQ